MNLEQVLDSLSCSEAFRACVTEWRRLPAVSPEYAPFPPGVRPELVECLRRRGITQLYSHQAHAVELAMSGRHVVVVTPTASGKTLCYNLPVLEAVLDDPAARALYLFPTKALSQDQLAELHALIDGLGADIRTHTYDGDTPAAARRAIRSAGHIVITNPDMLHTGILPHHTKWMKLFENLRYVVIDELHHYRGVFGSHLANLIRRLGRVCRFYGSSPRFILCSATIANPGELAAALLGQEVEVVDRNGAPRGEKHFVLYNPPVLNARLGIRRSCLLDAKALAATFLRQGIQTIVFGRTRLAVEVLLSYLREACASGGPPAGSETIRGYRGGYLPLERREIEKGLRSGRVRGVVSTNALELGVDIGQLDACVMAGYPGTVASTWQQAGRAGRRSGASVAVLVASSSPLDQYIVNHPGYFFGQSPEHGFVNPNNLYILLSHLKCAAFELPFEAGERFGVATTEDALRYLEQEGVLRHAGGRFYWAAESFPAEDISLRSASTANFVVIDCTRPEPRVIGEVDRFSAPMLIHEEAIYLHEGEQYQVERLDYEEKKAYVRRVEVDYYTDASLAVNLKVLREADRAPARGAERFRGEVQVNALATTFKKIKFHSHENVGWGKIHLPEEEMHTTAYWLALGPQCDRVPPADLQSALAGLANLVVNVAPILLMCDPRDIRAVAHTRCPFTGRPTVYVYDAYPGGVGLSERLFDLHDEVLAMARGLARDCACLSGCPSCTLGGGEEPNKAATIRLLDLLTPETARPVAALPPAAEGSPAHGRR